jgi:hypothetical protein
VQHADETELIEVRTFPEVERRTYQADARDELIFDLREKIVHLEGMIDECNNIVGETALRMASLRVKQWERNVA